MRCCGLTENYASISVLLPRWAYGGCVPTYDFVARPIHILEGLLPWIVFGLIVVLVLAIVTFVSLRVLDFRRLFRQSSVLLELTPPSGTDKTPEATSQLFAVLHGLGSSRSFVDKLLLRKVTFSLEVVSTRQLGIRYVIRVNEADAPSFEHTIWSYLPDAKLRRVNDYVVTNRIGRQARVIEAKQTGHYAYPLRTQFMLDQHDSMAYLTGAMTKLASGELVALQLVVSPAKIRGAATLSQRLFQNLEMVGSLGRNGGGSMSGVFSAMNSFLFSITESVGDVYHGSSSPGPQPAGALVTHQQQVAAGIKPARVLSAFEQELATSIHDKLSQPLFRVSIRAYILAENINGQKQRERAVGDWLSSFGDPQFQALRVKRELPGRPLEPYRRKLFAHRMPSFLARNSGVFSASEIAELYHVAHTEAAKTENIVRSLSKTLPAPISLKGAADFDVVIGRNVHHGAETLIGLTAAERQKHVYVLGGTGNGKTTMLEYAIVQDIERGKGVAVVDPHGDLAEKLLGYIPKARIKDVIYFNPADLGHPVGLNLLEIPAGLKSDELIEAKDFITESVVSLMRKVFSSDDTGGHRIEYILRNTIHTALTIEGATLFTIYDLLTDTKYRKKMVRSIEDPKLQNFWKFEFDKAGDFQQVKTASGVTAKIGRFQFSASAQRILSQPKSTIDFDEILNGKILICNLAKGLLGEDTSSLFGISILAKLQLAAYRRVRVRQEERRPFYLYVDEFQNFATMSFVQMLSEARKYRLFLTMAEQTTSQQDDQKMVQTILANVGTVICFRSGNPADERQLLPLFSPYIQEGEIANLPTYNFYGRLSAVLSQEPVSGETLVLEKIPNVATAKLVIDASRRRYAVKYVAPDNYVLVSSNTTASIQKNSLGAEINARPGD